METYTVHIDNNNWFSVDSKVIEFKKETVRIVNLRSIKGFISEEFNLSDLKLVEIIKHYLKSSCNVELLNIYSRRFNGLNWFEIYSNTESSEKELKNKLCENSRSSKSNENSELLENINISEKIDLSKIKSEIKDSKNRLIPSKLYENMNQNFPKFQNIDIDSCKFIPIWYINGSLQSNAKYTELYTTFEILIHILSKRFITFKSQLLSISSTEIQYAKIKGYDIEDYLRLEKKSLADLVLQKDKEIISLNAKMDEMMKEMKTQSNKIDNLQLDLDKKSEIIINQNQEIKDKTFQLEKSLSGLISTSKTALMYKQKSDELAKAGLVENKISTGNTNEIFILLFRKDLNEQYHTSFPNEPKEYIILDTISCQEENRNKLLYKDHKFDEETCEIIYETKKGNALDFNRFVKTHGSLIQPISNSKESIQIRKYKIYKSNLPYLIFELDRINNESKSIKDKIISNNKKLIENISDPLANVYEAIKFNNSEQTNELKDVLMVMNNQLTEMKNDNEKLREELKSSNENLINVIDKKLENNKQEIKTELENNKQEIIDSIKEIMKKPATTDDLNLISNSINQLLFKRRYREIYKCKKSGALVFFSGFKKGKPINPQLLTLEVLITSKFRDVNNKIFEPNENRKSKILSKYM